MSEIPNTSPLPIPASVAGKLRSLRRQIVTWFVVDGLARVLFWLIVLIGIDFVIDWLFRMDRPQRGIMLVLSLAVLAAVVIMRLVRPLLTAPSDEALCLAVEDRFGELRESLISAVQFSRIRDVRAVGASRSLVDATIDLGTQQARKLDFGAVLDRRGLALSWIAFLLLAATTGGIVIAAVSNTTLSLWYERNVLLADRPWPWDTYLIVEGAEDGQVIIPRGDDWTLTVTVSERSMVTHHAVYVDYRPAYGRPSEMLDEVPPGRQFETVVPRVMEPFQFRVRSNWSRSPWYEVVLVDRPEVTDLQLQVTEPEYAGGRVLPLPPDQGPYYVLKGSQLELRGSANKPLSAAAVHLGPFRAECAVQGSDFRARVAAEHFEPGVYEIKLLDQQDPEPLASRQSTRFTIKTRVDHEPKVRGRLDGISGMVVGGADIPISFQVTDDFAVTAVKLVYRWRTEESGAEGTTGEIDLAGDSPQLGGTNLSGSHLFPLSPLKLPAGAGLQFRILATDNDDVSGPKTGQSSEFLLKVVSEDELRANLLRREKEQRQELERSFKVQQDLQTQTEVLRAEIRGKSDFSSDQRKELMQVQKRQKLLGTNVAGVAERLARLIVEIRNNHLEGSDGPLQKRLTQQIVEPLQLLAETEIPAAARGLDEARRLAREPDKRNDALARTIDDQRKAVDALREILDHMEKTESYQEAVNLLYEVVKSQEDLKTRTIDAAQERIRELTEKKQPPGTSENEPEKDPD
jgi:hypothetical protein